MVHVGPAVFQLAEGPEGVQIAVLQLGGADFVDHAVADGLQLVVPFVHQHVGDGFDGLVHVGVIEEDALEFALHAAGRLAEIVHAAGVLTLGGAMAGGDLANGVDAVLPHAAENLDLIERDGLQNAMIISHKRVLPSEEYHAMSIEQRARMRKSKFLLNL